MNAKILRLTMLFTIFGLVASLGAPARAQTPDAEALMKEAHLRPANC